MMMLALVQANPHLAKGSSSVLSRAAMGSANGVSNGNGNDLVHLGRTFSEESSAASPYTLDTPVDMSTLYIDNDREEYDFAQTDVDVGEPYTFIPPDPREYYTALLSEVISHDCSSQDGRIANSISLSESGLLSRTSVELLKEIGSRWRLPIPSRLVLLLDAVRQKFEDRELDLDTLDAAFSYFKDPPAIRDGSVEPYILFDRTRWTLTDYVLNQKVLAKVHDMLLRDLSEQLERSYETQAPDYGPIMVVLDSHIYNDELFSRTEADLDRFGDHLRVSLRGRALETYNSIFAKEISQHGPQAEFFHLIQLGKAVVKLIERVEKRFRRTPIIMGYESKS